MAFTYDNKLCERCGLVPATREVQYFAKFPKPYRIKLNARTVSYCLDCAPIVAAILNMPDAVTAGDPSEPGHPDNPRSSYEVGS